MSENITAKNYKKLALQIALNGMSFCVFDTLNGTVSGITHSPFSKTLPLEDELWRMFVEHPELKMAYDEITVLHDNSLNTFVPNALFDAGFLGSYLQYNTKVFETDAFAFDAIGNYELNNVYVPFMNVNNYLIDRFGSFEYKNTNSVLVAKLLDASKNIDEKQVFVHVQRSHFEIVVARNQKLLLYNSFEYSTPEDLLYYLLFTMEQLSLNPETATVKVLGNSKEDDARFELAYTYIRNITLYEPETLMVNYNTDAEKARQHFILMNA